jgi:hypothetical protein
MNAEPNEISPSYYSDFAGGSGAVWEFDPDFTSSNLCSTKTVTSATFSDGVFAEF